MGRNKETQPGQVLTLNELVAYQTGAVVSRTLVNKKGGTVTMFSFDTGEGLDGIAHTYPLTVEGPPKRWAFRFIRRSDGAPTL